jgi:hypothetical protein
MDIHAGTRFNTKFETNCVATSEPDESGNFDGIDSGGVEVEFNTAMVTEVIGWAFTD